MTDLLQAIHEKEGELARVQQELNTLKAAYDILAQKDARPPYNAVSKTQQPAPARATGPDPTRRLPLNMVNSQPAMAEAVLRERHTPTHAAQIARLIKEKFGRDVAMPSLTTILFKYSKRNKTFYKDKRKKNTYGLLEWRQQQALLPEKEERETPEISAWQKTDDGR